jgi:hypothetical protein
MIKKRLRQRLCAITRSKCCTVCALAQVVGVSVAALKKLIRGETLKHAPSLIFSTEGSSEFYFQQIHQVAVVKMKNLRRLTLMRFVYERKYSSSFCILI